MPVEVVLRNYAMELASPITIYWDLPPGVAVQDSLLRTCADIAACRPLMLNLNDSSSYLGAGVRAVLEQFRKTPISVSLTIIPPCLASLGSTSPPVLGVKGLLVSLERIAELRALRALPSSVGISFTVRPENWRELPDLVASCRERGISRLVLPMQRLYNGEEPFLLTRQEQMELERSLDTVGGVQDINLTIHDPFLWKAFNPGVPFPQGGCQAANTMIAIAADGGVYPCPTLPVRLGTIGERPLKEIISSAEKKEFRRRLLVTPEGCRECQELAECRGGCRGRAYVMQGTLDGIDEACR
jgi:GeoRSP system SPASM domain protein